MTDRIGLIPEEVEFLLAEASALAASGPTIKIFVQPDPGEELSTRHLIAAAIACGAKDNFLRLSTALLWFLHYLAMHRWRGQSASQIADGIRRDRFFGRGPNGEQWRLARTSVKVYVDRLLRALALTLNEAGLNLNASEIMVSEPVDGKHVLYRLKAHVEIITLES